MKDKQGWIKIYRKIQDNDIWKKKEPFDSRSAWIDLLLLANHSDNNILLSSGEELTVHIGQHFTSYQKLAERWHWSRNKVIRFLNYLAKQHMCTVCGMRSGTLITLEKYSIYQGSGASKKSERYTGDTTDGTADRTAMRNKSGTRTRMILNKNDSNKNDKQERATGPNSFEGKFEK